MQSESPASRETSEIHEIKCLCIQALSGRTSEIVCKEVDPHLQSKGRKNVKRRATCGLKCLKD